MRKMSSFMFYVVEKNRVKSESCLSLSRFSVICHVEIANKLTKKMNTLGLCLECVDSAFLKIYSYTKEWLVRGKRWES